MRKETKINYSGAAKLMMGFFVATMGSVVVIFVCPRYFGGDKTEWQRYILISCLMVSEAYLLLFPLALFWCKKINLFGGTGLGFVFSFLCLVAESKDQFVDLVLIMSLMLILSTLLLLETMLKLYEKNKLGKQAYAGQMKYHLLTLREKLGYFPKYNYEEWWLEKGKLGEKDDLECYLGARELNLLRCALGMSFFEGKKIRREIFANLTANE